MDFLENDPEPDLVREKIDELKDEIQKLEPELRWREGLDREFVEDEINDYEQYILKMEKYIHDHPRP